MSIYLARIICLLLLILSFSCQQKSARKQDLRSALLSQLDSIRGNVAIAFYNLSDPNDSLLIKADEVFHAASTMKVPVMIELFKQQEQGTLNLDDSILLKNEFKSIVDSSLYSMQVDMDSDSVIYSKIGTQVAIKDLMYSMVTVSSNLATNVLIELVGAKNTTSTMRSLGADKIEVLRGVEDTKAYELGMSNMTTAKDLMLIMKAIAEQTAGTEEDCERMIKILKDQQFNTIIPFYLPEDVSVAHKTGAIVGLHHDAGIVYLPDGRAYILVLLSNKLEDYDKATEQLAGLSKTFYEYVVKEGVSL
ncbi:serine hydrolase [Algoriphagus sp. D3-2-R+10]|uniref:serine hydrolase n=1 Tax=Algoriphagus aurantiacus TaxID=3103948 RepID=UPI002B3813CC|nr:serine hydrolase [Algoriphagus sp. D3-2-R+10]MEB2773848.1 serine hydrolase [Algoriphagus sp. D3-2-R+10]